MSASCKSCGAKIVWAEIGEKKIPLNARRVRVYERTGIDQYAETRDGRGSPLLVHISHFATCPNASQHSKEGKSK